VKQPNVERTHGTQGSVEFYQGRIARLEAALRRSDLARQLAEASSKRAWELASWPRRPTTETPTATDTDDKSKRDRPVIERRPRVVTSAASVWCAFCRRPFAPVRPHQKYCRPSCRWEAFKTKRAEASTFDENVSGLFE
jgi:hypothetical protein